jgi:NAD-dependent SIR2 family protein deacetylase
MEEYEPCELCGKPLGEDWNLAGEVGEVHLTCVLERAECVCSKCEAYYWTISFDDLSHDEVLCPDCGGAPRVFLKSEIPKHIAEAKKEYGKL